MQFKRKIPSFVFGVSIGLLIGIAFFLFKIDSIFNKLKSSITSDKITVIEQKMQSDEEKQKAKNKERFKIKTNYGNKVNYKEVDSIINSGSEENINIAVDQLISSRVIKIIQLSDKNNNDSLALNLAGVNTVSSDSYTIEFWRTPLNSKGYRFVKNKIMLYGFNDHSNILLYLLNDRYFLKSFEVVYELAYSSEFQPFIKVNNTELLSKLNS